MQVKKRLLVLASSLSLVFAIALAAGATTAQTDRSFECLNPQGAPGTARVAFTGTLNDAQEFYQKTETVASLGNAVISQWTDGLPIIIPTEEAVREMLTGTSHQPSEVMSTYSKSPAGQWVKDAENASFLPSGWQATVEQVAVNAVMAGCKPEYLPTVLAMMSGGPNYKVGTEPTGYAQILAGPVAKEIGMNAGQGAHNPGNPPSMTIGRAFELCLINLGGAIPGSTNTNQGNPFNRANLCYGEDIEALPEGWVGMNEDMGFTAEESVIMICQHSSVLLTTFAPSSFRSLNSGHGGMAMKLDVEGVAGFHNPIEYMMRWSIIPDETTFGAPIIGASAIGPQGPICWTVHPDIALSLFNAGYKSKADFYRWVSDRAVIPLSEYRKYGYYDILTANGTAIELTSGKPYNELAPDYPVHVLGQPEEQLIIISIYPGDESILAFSGGRGIARCIDPWE
jgi:hypothetical protein